MGGRGSTSNMTSSRSGPSYVRADDGTQTFHGQQVRKLSGDEYPNYKTYDLNTLQVKEYSSGYQVTFCQIGDNYSPSEYADRVNEFLGASSDGVASAGKYDGTPEVSFHCADRRTAVRLAKKYNQESVYDWGTGNLIFTGGTGRRE